MKLLVVTLISLGACTVSDEWNATPTGIVAGEVVDGTTGLPLADASIVIWDGDSELSGQTDNRGRFSLDGAPAGSSLWVDVFKDSYALQRYSVAIDDSSGEQPQDNSRALLDVELFPSSGTLQIRVMDGLTPVANVALAAEGTALFGSYKMPEIFTGTTNGAGEAVIDGIAAYHSYHIRVAPFMHNGQLVSIPSALVSDADTPGVFTEIQLENQ